MATNNRRDALTQLQGDIDVIIKELSARGDLNSREPFTLLA